MINSNTSTSQTELQDIQQENSRGVISNATRATGTFGAQYPLLMALQIPVIDAGPGFDALDLEAKLGPTRFASLMSGVKQVFCCAHRTYPAGHELAGSELHCVEAFLEQEAA